MTQDVSRNGFLAAARTDGSDCLIEADEPLAGLQTRCGGAMDAPLAIPEMLALVRKARKYAVPLAREIAVNYGEEQVLAWVEAVPLGVNGADGCHIGITNWTVSPVTHDNQMADVARRIAVSRAAAELFARLDSKQNVLAAQSSASDLRQLADAMNSREGTPWTDFVTLPGSEHRQPVHWRLLDGAVCSVNGSSREWRAVLAPLGASEAGRDGFELYLVSDEAPPQIGGQDRAEEIDTPSLGKDLAPILRQPVARIIANAETIRTRMAGPLTEEYSGYAADIAAAGQHLLDLIEDLADLEVVESERFATAPDRIDLNDVARRAAGILSVRAREKNIGLTVPPESADEVPAIAEFRRVLQVLLNLLGNAIKYSPENSSIELMAGHSDGWARISVADQGPGLDESQRAAMFDKFERLGRTGDSGSGLGLYISRRLADAMGGKLRVESEPGHGARFTLTLPDPD